MNHLCVQQANRISALKKMLYTKLFIVCSIWGHYLYASWSKAIQTMRSDLLIIFETTLFLGRFTNFRKATIIFVLSLSLSAYPSVRRLSVRLSMCLPFRLKQLDPSGKIFMRFRIWIIFLEIMSGKSSFINHLTPNGHFSGRTAPLTFRCRIFLFIQQIYVLYILNMLHTLRFFLFKMPFIS